jgi:pimeloyl-ACP methyl ester carboxylesterase
MSRPRPRFLPLVLAAVLATVLAGCAGLPDPAARRQAVLDQAASHGLVPLPPSPTGLPVLALGRDGPGQDLVVYIEGDGLAFLNRSTPSPDPTPVHALALGLALADPAPKVAYLGRPCQYAAPLPPACREDLWTGARFGPEAVAALSDALSDARAALGARRLHLVGYSGGGAMAVLLAARRDDVADIVTVAGNLDTRAWTTWHRVTPLTASANPADAAASVALLPQVHVSGADDTVCPPFLAEVFLERLGHPPGARRLVLPGVDHHRGIEAAWPRVLDRVRQGAMALPGGPPPDDSGKASPVLPGKGKWHSP